MQPLSADVLAALRQFDSPTVSNAIELLDCRARNAGFMNGSIRAMFPEMPPMVGHAVTATFRSAWPPTADETPCSIDEQVRRFLEIPEPRVVVFQDLDDPPCGATFGEVMCTTYQRFGCVGLITSGGARDLDQVRALGFPCFASSVIVSHAYCRVMDLMTPIHVGGCTVRPGDLVHGDANGVVLVPPDRAADTATACRAVVKSEGLIFDYLKRDPADPAGLADALARCAAGFRAVTTRLAHQPADDTEAQMP